MGDIYDSAPDVFLRGGLHYPPHIEGIKQELADIRREAQALKVEVQQLRATMWATRRQIREAFPEAGFDDY
jgi:hypothetical protein